MSKLSVDEKIEIFRRIGEEIQEESELRQLFEKQDTYRVYDGFEPSGRIHIAQGILRAININRMIKCGCHCIFLVADWYALLNNKCGGNMDHIQKLGKYFIKVWEQSGMQMDHVEFIWAGELIAGSKAYWPRVLDISKINTISRIQKCSTIMGRTESDKQPISQIIYPCMQCSDIFELRADICQLGLDQRKVNMLAREYADRKNITKPVVVSHHMLLGLIGGKMSKSVQGSSIFMDDTLEDITQKVMAADCELKEEDNPILEYFKYLVFPAIEVELQGYKGPIKASGSDKEYQTYEELRDDFLAEKVTADQLKHVLISVIDTLIAPVREAFSSSPELRELQQFAISTRLTR